MTTAAAATTAAGCVGIIVTIMVLWSLWFGLPTPWGEFNIDIFPPAIRLEVAVEAPDEG